MEVLDEQLRINILSSLEDVGKTKAVGYLPLNTIESILSRSLQDLALEYSSRDLRVKIFDRKHTFIKSGAFFVYDATMCGAIMQKYKSDLLSKKWKMDTEYVITRLAGTWFAENDLLMTFIRELYGAPT